jgi:hypothetical protein
MVQRPPLPSFDRTRATGAIAGEIDQTDLVDLALLKLLYGASNGDRVSSTAGPSTSVIAYSP